MYKKNIISVVNFNTDFLDVNINNSHEHVVTQPFVKPSESGIYLNYNSECPNRCKDATIRSMILTIIANARIGIKTPLSAP